VDSSALPALVDLKLLMKTEPLPSLKSSTKPIPKVTRGFITNNSLCWLRNSQWKLARCRLRNHHLKTFQRRCVDSEVLAALLTQKKTTRTESVVYGKSSRKQLPKVTRGFISAPNPCWLRNC
jgi:hypothetical protein